MINTNISISQTEIVQKYYNTSTESTLSASNRFSLCVWSTTLCLSSTSVCYCSTMRVPGGSSVCSPQSALPPAV